MEWSSIGRLWAFPRRNSSSRARWEYIGLKRSDAFRMMDGSTCEEDLQRRGGQMAQALAGALDILPHQHVLEVGCGVARIGRELAPHCGTYTGADISASLLRHARRRTGHIGNASFVHLAAAGLDSLPAGRFQRLLCHLVFLHLDEKEIRGLLRGFGRVLAADGAAYFDAWNLRHPQVWDLFRRESLDPRLRRQPHRSRFYTPEALEDWLDASGLQLLWSIHSSFLIQAVVARRDADALEMAALRSHLQRDGAGLLPGDHTGLDPQPAPRRDS